jgi:hypothetical protein
VWLATALVGPALMRSGVQGTTWTMVSLFLSSAFGTRDGCDEQLGIGWWSADFFSPFQLRVRMQHGLPS